MSFQPRPYQQECIDANKSFFSEKKKYNGINILPTGSGKSVVIANTAAELSGKTVVFQPSKEILEQNFKKFLSYGFRAGIYSHSAGMKYMDDITFATIGSVHKKKHLFREFKNIIIDECHLVNPSDGMYNDFIRTHSHARVLGLTATPYRLEAGSAGPELRFITRQTPRIFNQVIYSVQNDVLFNNGFLCPLEYYTEDVLDRNQLETNKAGTDFTDESVRKMYGKINMAAKTIDYTNRILAKRDNILVFCSLISEAEKVVRGVPGAYLLTGKTPDAQRAMILKKFTRGEIRCVVNVGVLTTGFDYPELQAVLLARSTMSLSLYYQMVGRVMRPHPSKTCGWVVDLCGNNDFFGPIETMRIEQTKTGLYYVSNQGKQLTNVPFRKK